MAGACPYGGWHPHVHEEGSMTASTRSCPAMTPPHAWGRPVGGRSVPIWRMCWAGLFVGCAGGEKHLRNVWKGFLTCFVFSARFLKGCVIENS